MNPIQFKETDDIWRLYHREWSIAYTSDTVSNSVQALDAAQEWAQQNLAGRISADDIRYEMRTDEAGSFWAYVMVFKDNLKGEFKHPELAQQHAVRNNFQEYVIVPRNSKSDHEIRSYGVVKL